MRFKIGDVVYPMGSGELAVVIRAPEGLPVAVRWPDGTDGFYRPDQLLLIRPFPEDYKWSEHDERNTDFENAWYEE